MSSRMKIPEYLFLGDRKTLESYAALCIGRLYTAGLSCYLRTNVLGCRPRSHVKKCIIYSRSSTKTEYHEHLQRRDMESELP